MVKVLVDYSAEFPFSEESASRFICGNPLSLFVSPRLLLLAEMIHASLASLGSRVVLAVVLPHFPPCRAVTIYRPDAEPQLVNASQELSGEPHLPGFRVAVADLFV